MSNPGKVVTQSQGYGTAAARPVAGSVVDGSTYYATDTKILYQAQAGAWVSVAGGAATVTLAKMVKTNAQNLPTGNDKILLNSATFDTAGGWTPASNRWVCPAGQAGYYQVSGQIHYSVAVSPSDCMALIYKNGVLELVGSGGQFNTTGGGDWSANVTGLVSLAVGDYLELWSLVNSGSGALNFFGAAGQENYLSLVKVG